MARIKIGILSDVGDSPVAGILSPADAADIVERCLARSGSFSDDPGTDADNQPGVEFIHAYGMGLPSGTAEAVEQAFDHLVKSGASLILGPALDDNAIIAATRANECRVPIVHWARSERACGRYAFRVSATSTREEAEVLSAHLTDLGLRRIAIIHDMTPHGLRQCELVRTEIRRRAFPDPIVCPAGTDADDIRETLDALTAPEIAPEALVRLDAPGSPLPIESFLAQVQASQWRGPVLLNRPVRAGDGLPACSQAPHGSQAHDIWQVETLDGANTTLIDALNARTPDGGQPGHGLRSDPFDEPRLLATATDLARIARQAVERIERGQCASMREALEQVRTVPSAHGPSGTQMGFTPTSRSAFHHSDRQNRVLRMGRPGALEHAIAPIRQGLPRQETA